MVWQDTIISICIVLFSYALIPQVYQGFKEKKGFVNTQTSFITFIGMYVLSFVYFTLGLYFSFIMGVITGTLWFLLFVQKMVYG